MKTILNRIGAIRVQPFLRVLSPFHYESALRLLGNRLCLRVIPHLLRR